MDREEMRAVMEELAMSQGFYGRLLYNIDSAPEEEADRFWEEMEKQNFSTPLDVVLFLEC